MDEMISSTSFDAIGSQIAKTKRDVESNVGRISDNKRFLDDLSGQARLFFKLKLLLSFFRVNLLMIFTRLTKRCYFGPFKGEFGHFLAHVLPFISYLHKHGVKVYYCGMALHQPFLINENGDSMVESVFPLRDFFFEISPRSNSVLPPQDVQAEIDKFYKMANSSFLPLWNLGNDFFYWFVFREWLVKSGHLKVVDRSVRKEQMTSRAIALFPRKKGAASSRNNGGPWDYQSLINSLSPLVDEINITGHPALSGELAIQERVNMFLSTDNAQIIASCSRSQLIITQHSGAVYLGEYTGSDVLIIYHGVPPIGSLQNTLRFKSSLGTRSRIFYAFSEEEVVTFVEHYFNSKK